MASNKQEPPKESFLNAGIKVDEELLEQSLSGKLPISLKSSVSSFLKPNPEFVPDNSGIYGYTNGPNVWSDPNTEPEFINPDSEENVAIIQNKEKEFTAYRRSWLTD